MDERRRGLEMSKTRCVIRLTWRLTAITLVAAADGEEEPPKTCSPPDPRHDLTVVEIRSLLPGTIMSSPCAGPLRVPSETDCIR